MEEVKGFTNKPGLGKGYVYFSKTRCGNSGLWLHWLEHVALPTMKQNNAFYGANDAKGQPLPTFFSTDGEALILRQAFEPRIISALKAENVYYARVGAGSTGIHQACDRAQTFKITKKGPGSVSKILQLNRIPSDEFLEANIRRAFDNFLVRFPSISCTSRIMSRIVQSLIILKSVYQNKVTPNVIKKGFTCCGQHCDPINPGSSTVSFDIMMEQCYSDISREQLQLMRQCISHFVEVIKSRGQIKFEELCDKGLRPGSTTIARDELHYVRHWAEVINHEFIVDHFNKMCRLNSEEYKQQLKNDALIAKDDDRRIRLEAAAKKRREMTQEEKCKKKSDTAKKKLERLEELAAARQEQQLRRAEQPVVQNNANNNEQEAPDDI